MLFSNRKLLLASIPALAAGGVGVWMLMGKFGGGKEQKRPLGVVLSQKRSNAAKETKNTVKQQEKTKVEPSGDTDLKSLDVGSPKHNVEEKQQHKEPEVPKDTHEPPKQEQDLKGPQQQEDPPRLPEQRVQVDEKSAGDKLKEQMKGTGIDCGDAAAETYCTTGTGTINVDIGGVKKEDYVFSGGDNGRIRLRISDDLTHGKKFSFSIAEKAIKLESKTNPGETLVLEKYEKYELVRDEGADKVYLTRRLTSEQGMIKDLRLPADCSKKITSEPFNYQKPNVTCELKKHLNQIQLVNFDGKKEGGATSEGNLRIFIQKVKDTATYKDGYKFFIQGYKEIDISDKVKLAADVWWDFRLKDGGEDKLLLERVWGDEKELLRRVGLSCDEKGKCSINNNSLKIKVGNRSMEKGRMKSDSKGSIYLEKKNTPGHYEGLRFSVWGGEMTMEDSSSPDSTLKMEEAEIYHITKEDEIDSSYYLTRKHGVEEMIEVHLGIKSCRPEVKTVKSCIATESHWKKIKFHDGEGEKTIAISEDNKNLSITIIVTANQNKTKYPFGYKFTLKPSKDVNIGNISLRAKTDTDFRVMRDIENKKLYLEKAA